jgi:hypothetical protein
LGVDIEGKNITLINIYGPNNDTPLVYNKVSETIEYFNNQSILISYSSFIIFSKMGYPVSNIYCSFWISGSRIHLFVFQQNLDLDRCKRQSVRYFLLLLLAKYLNILYAYIFSRNEVEARNEQINIFTHVVFCRQDNTSIRFSTEFRPWQM